MGIFCVVLAVVALIMCLVSLIWNGVVVVNNHDEAERGHGLFHLLKVFVVVPSIVVLLFVFADHLQCNDRENTWETKSHSGACPRCRECPKPLKPEAEPQGGR